MTVSTTSLQQTSEKSSRPTSHSFVPSPGLESISLASKIGALTVNPLKNVIVPAETLINFLKSSQSPLLEESFQRPGGWRSMQIIYRNETPVDWLDDQALRANPMSLASRNRCRIVIQKLAKIISELPANEHINVLGVGSGPGVQIQTGIAESGIEKDRVTAYLIDLDDDAREFGESISEQLGLTGRVHFRTGDARRISDILPDTEIHLAKLVGILEYLTDDELLEMLQAVKEIMVPKGVIVTHAINDAYHAKPFLRRVFNLHHQYRSEKHMKALLSEAGFKCTDCTIEPTGIYPILTAVRDS